MASALVLLLLLLASSAATATPPTRRCCGRRRRRRRRSTDAQSNTRPRAIVTIDPRGTDALRLVPVLVVPLLPLNGGASRGRRRRVVVSDSRRSWRFDASKPACQACQRAMLEVGSLPTRRAFGEWQPNKTTQLSTVDTWHYKTIITVLLAPRRHSPPARPDVHTTSTSKLSTITGASARTLAAPTQILQSTLVVHG